MTMGEDKPLIHIRLKTPSASSGTLSKSSIAHVTQLRVIFDAVMGAFRMVKSGLKFVGLTQLVIKVGIIPIINLVESNFKVYDQSFLDAIEFAQEAWGKDLLILVDTPSSWESFTDSICPMMVKLARMAKEPSEVEYVEHILRVIGKMVQLAADNNLGDLMKKAVMNREKKLLKLIDDRNMEEVDKMWAEGQSVLLILVEMERYPCVLRLAIRTVLRCAIALPTLQGDARIHDFLDSLTFEPKVQVGHWHKKIICIEMANCAYANGFERFYDFIHLKVTELLMEIEDNPNIIVDEKIITELKEVEAGGKKDWRWDMDEQSEMSWWFQPQ